MPNFPDARNLDFLQFIPLYKRRIWGGNLLSTSLNRELPPTAPGEDPFGESWELCDRPEDQSVVAAGTLTGTALNELIEFYGPALMGSFWKRGERFPLLVKFIDAGERLSLQVHPDERYCQEVNDGSEPKTEMWYVFDCESHGEILAGLTAKTTRDQLIAELSTPRAANMLQRFPSHPGDSYFIQAGTVHAIGAGNLIFEIQQNSDTTFRISDWGRVGLDGKPRALHLEQGIRAIGFTNHVSPRIPAVVGETRFNRKFPLVDRHCFKVDCLRLVEDQPENTGGIGGSFHYLSVMSGSVKITSPGVNDLTLNRGESALVPAVRGSYMIQPQGNAAVLKSYQA